MKNRPYTFKVVKKDGLDEEVPDGERGRIMPFDLIQQQYFAAELQEIADLRSHLDGIASDLEEWRDTLADDEDGMAYLDSDKDNALDKKKITLPQVSKDGFRRLLSCGTSRAKPRKW